MPVGDYCQRDVVTVRAEDSVRDAANLMRSQGVGCVVVIDDDENAVGIVTDRDIVQRAVRRVRDAETVGTQPGREALQPDHAQRVFDERRREVTHHAAV